MQRRQYSDQDKAAALAALDANSGNVYKTAKQLQLSESTLRSWSTGRGTNADVADLREDKKKHLAERLEDIAHILIDALPGKIADANLQQTTTSLGIALDKMQLLKGHATQRVDINDTALSDEDRAAKIAALLAKVKSRAADG